MPILFQGPVHVAYHQMYVERQAEHVVDDPTSARGGQTNGLCGAALPGFLFLTTGLHTGTIDVTVEALADRPPLDDAWEEVVEVSFRPAGPRVALVPVGR